MRILRAWQTSFLGLAAVWGCSFWWMKLGLEALSPLGVAFGRLLLGALALSIILLVSTAGLPRGRRTWGHLAVVAVLLNSVPFTLFAFGETLISSVLAGIINAMTPLATLVVVLVAYPEERPTRDRVIGLLIGFLGVLVVLGVWQGVTSGEAVGVLACLIAVTCYGIAYPYVRRHLSGTGEGPLPLATAQVLLGGLILLPVVLLEQLLGPGVVQGPWPWDAVLGMLALGVLGSGVAYVLNFRVIAAAGAATASAVTYLTPVVAVAVGVAVLGEHVAWYQPVGAGIVLAGVAASQGGSPAPAEPPAPDPDRRSNGPRQSAVHATTMDALGSRGWKPGATSATLLARGPRTGDSPVAPGPRASTASAPAPTVSGTRDLRGSISFAPRWEARVASWRRTVKQSFGGESALVDAPEARG